MTTDNIWTIRLSHQYRLQPVQLVFTKIHFRVPHSLIPVSRELDVVTISWFLIPVILKNLSTLPKLISVEVLSTMLCFDGYLGNINDSLWKSGSLFTTRVDWNGKGNRWHPKRWRCTFISHSYLSKGEW